MSSTKVRTPLGRFSYPSLINPSKPEGSDGDPTYNVTLIFPSDTNLDDVKAAIRSAASDKWSEDKLKALIKADKFRNPIKPNSLRTDDDGKPYAGYEDQDGFHLTAKAYSNDKYVIVDKDRQVIGPELVVAGYWGKAIVNFVAYDKAGNQGVTAYLSGIQVCKKDETFGSAVAASVDEFDEEEGDSLSAVEETDAALF